jgi:hypothetical protein
MSTQALLRAKGKGILAHLPLASVLGVLGLVATPAAALAQTVWDYAAPPVSASVPPYTVKVEVLRATDQQDDVLLEQISTSDPENHSVYCFDGLRDLEYVLRDNSGEIIPLADTWRNHVDFMSGYGQYNPKGPNGPDPCKAIKAPETNPRVQLSWLYPSLKPGTYTLQVILAPHGTTGRAATPALTITIPNK